MNAEAQAAKDWQDNGGRFDGVLLEAVSSAATAGVRWGSSGDDGGVGCVGGGLWRPLEGHEGV